MSPRYVPNGQIKLSPENVSNVSVTIGAKCPHCKGDMRVAESRLITLTDPPRRRINYWCDNCQIEVKAEVEDNDSPSQRMKRLESFWKGNR